MRNSSGAFERGLDILAVLSSEDRALGAASLAARLRVPKSTVYRILRVLRRRGLVREVPGERAYRLGLIILQWAHTVQKGLDVVQIAAPALHRLAEATGETVQLTLPDGDRAVTVDVVESPSPVRVAPERGRALPLHCGAAAKAILAHLPEARWQALTKTRSLATLTSKTLTSPRRLLADLRATRARGYAHSQEEVYEGAAGIAAPIFDERGSVCGSLAISGPVHRLRDRRRHQAAALLQQEAELLSRALGFQQPHKQQRRA